MVDNKKLGSIGLKAFWIKIFSLVSLITGNVDVIGKGDLQTQIDSMSEKVDQCFTSASNGKAAIASAITGKGVNTASDATFATMAANIGNIKTSPRLQAKNAALSTAAQTIKPDTGYDGLSQVSVPAVSGNAGTGDVLANKTFSSGSAGISKTGTLADKTGTTDHSAEASIDGTNKRIKLKVPATAKYSVGNYLYATYTTIANLIGLTAAKLVKGNTILGITGNNNNMDTSGADAAAGDILSGKKAGVKGSLITGTMPNKGAWTGTVAAASKITIPAGYHNGNGYAQCTDKGYNQGVTDADNRVNTNSANYKGGYNAGVSAADGRVNADSANYKGGYNAGVSATKKGTAGAGDVLSGKTFTNSSSVGASGTMPNKGSTTQDATATQDDTYTYLTVPVAGYYNTASKLRTKNSNLRHTVNNCFRVTPGTSVLVRAAATLWGTAVNFSGGSVYYLDGITEIAVTKIAGATAKLQIIPYNIDNNTADISNSKNINAGNSLTENFIGYYVVTPYVNASNTTTVSNSSKSATLKVDFS